MSNTPRTDAAFGGMAATDAGYWKTLDHARDLERENAALREERDTLADIAAQAQRDLVEQTKSLRADKARLVEALRMAKASFLGLQPDFGGPIAQQMGAAIQRIDTALAGTPTTPPTP